MVRFCCAVGCSNKETKDSTVTFHKIPSDPERRKLWLNAIRRIDPDTKKPWKPSNYACLCSDHFNEDDFYFSKHANYHILKDSAVPTKFQWTKEQTSRKTSVSKRSLDLSEENCPAGESENLQVVNKFIQSEHSYTLGSSSDEVKKKYVEMREKLEYTQQEFVKANRRAKRSRDTTAKVLQEMNDLKKLTDQANEMLENYKDIPINLFEKPSNEYTEDQRLFATTLYFYGPKAYSYVRDKLHLPHPSTIRRWLSSIDGRPGFSQQVLDMLETKRQLNPAMYRYCSIMVDGMSIRKHIEWDPMSKHMVGFVDLGSGSLENDSTEAREVLVIMAVGLTGHWKIPLGYFLIDGISADVQCQLILSAINSLHSISIRAVSLIMDGHPTNQKMVNVLGCRLETDNIISSFCHPSDDSLKVYVFFDACHLFKNLRGALHSLQELSEESIGKACWNDIVRLQRLQENEGLRAANKLTSKHINFQQQKMNVKLAVQTLSSSVAKALEFVSKNNCGGLENCSGTINFISLVDHMFDIFNSRTPAIKSGFKCPIRKSNYEHIERFLLNARKVLLNLKDMLNRKVCLGKRKIAFVGFVFNIDSILALAKELLYDIDNPLSYLLTYKLSQDHLELFFSAVRRFGGWNNNPSAQQFSAAYRSLLCHNGVNIHESYSSNCIPQDITSILNVSIDEPKPVLTFVDALFDHDYSKVCISNLSPYIDGIIEYIAGWVVRKVSKSISCPECSHALIQPVSSYSKGLLEIKNNGGLCVPSNDVVKIVREAEIVIRSSVHIKHVKPNEWENVCVNSIIRNLPVDLFKNLNEHFLHTSKDLQNHYMILVKLICKQFVKLRRNYCIKLTNINLEGKALRKKLTKTILFNNQ